MEVSLARLPLVEMEGGEVRVGAARPNFFAVSTASRGALADVLVTGALELDVLVKNAGHRPVRAETD